MKVIYSCPTCNRENIEYEYPSNTPSVVVNCKECGEPLFYERTVNESNN